MRLQASGTVLAAWVGVLPGTGILANNILGEDDLHPDGFHAAPPGIRVSSMMSPTIVVGPTGATELVVGSGGSKRIRSAVLQALLNVVVHGLDPRAAVEGARVHWDVDHVEAEPGLDPAVLAAIRALDPGAGAGVDVGADGADVDG
ncbi:gamma-glutamyltransferase, partial [Bradyrhizobium sp. NBAIM08]|uniref:gamma-glutamyltransferase n=1 Tax=Bradyrhizobium sp. NBAIM08 TaxID=2793815 RepID=UPI001CD5777B